MAIVFIAGGIYIIMPNDGFDPELEAEGDLVMEPDGVLLADIGTYLQARRVYLLAKRDGAESEFGKAKFIGALQAVNDFDTMLKQLRVVKVPGAQKVYASQTFPESLEELGARLLKKFGLPQCAIRDFRDNAWRDKLINALPSKKAEILLMAQYARNPEILSMVLQVLRENIEGPERATPPEPDQEQLNASAPVKVNESGPVKVNDSAPVKVNVSGGDACPYCGRVYKYVKSLTKHMETCARKRSP